MLKKRIIFAGFAFLLAIASPLMAKAIPQLESREVGNGVLVGVRSGDSEDYILRNGGGVSGGTPAVLQGVMVISGRSPFYPTAWPWFPSSRLETHFSEALLHFPKLRSFRGNP
ncbi:MAG: hypothetical protein D3910_28880 [Candidatus Electrothrix sp. ATG2]|nr:hypothetical protein [Candidatus Electrothrix sp. ATG2]